MLTIPREAENAHSKATLPSFTRLSRDLALDATSQMIYWTPAVDSLQPCKLEFKAKAGRASDFFPRFDAIVEQTELREGASNNPLATEFAKSLLEFCDLSMLAGCVVKGIHLCPGNMASFFCENVVLIDSILQVHGTFDCRNLILSSSVLEANVSSGLLQSFCVDHTSLLRGSFGTTRLDKECRIHGLAYELDLSNVTFDSPETLQVRLSEGVFSRANLPQEEFFKQKSLLPEPETLKEAVRTRLRMTDSLSQKTTTRGPAQRQFETVKQRNDCISFQSFSVGSSVGLREKSSSDSSQSSPGREEVVNSRTKALWRESMGIPKLLLSDVSKSVELPSPHQNPKEWSAASYSDLDLLQMMALLSLEHVPTLKELRDHVEEIRKALKGARASTEEKQRVGKIIDESYYGLALPQNRVRLSEMLRTRPDLISQSSIELLFKD